MLRGGAVALFVFFAGAAGAGIVAADFGAGADAFGGFGLSGAGLVLEILLGALLAAFDALLNFELLRTRAGFFGPSGWICGALALGGTNQE